jgi:hypothetical protein
MNGLDLRPLTLGEILDRTFTLYRSHFLLFLGIAGVPQILVLTVRLWRDALEQRSTASSGSAASVVAAVALVCLVVVLLVAYLFSQGGTLFAVSEIYLGRSTTTITGALQRVRGNFGSLFGVAFVNGLAIIGASILFVVPGIYVACRLLVCVPAALIEGRGPRDSLDRSWQLTDGSAGRAFVILLLYAVVAVALGLLAGVPAGIGIMAPTTDPHVLWFWQIVQELASSAATILTRPILLIATAIFYYDLRVRKEGFDLKLNAPETISYN